MSSVVTEADALESLAYLERRAAATDDEVHRQAIAAMRGRLIGEMVGDLDQTLAQCDPRFAITMHLPDGSTHQVATQEEIRGMFEGLTSRENPIVLWMEFDHLVIEGRTFASDGVTRTLCTASGARALGLEPDADDGIYVVSQRVSTMVDFNDDGLHTNEVVYMSPAARTLERLPDPSQESPGAIRAAVQGALGLE